MATTTNYSWTTPDDTDLVKDGAAAIRTLGSAIDTSLAANEGDLLLGGTSDIFEPLAIGAAATVLTSDGTTASWAPPASGLTLISRQSFTTVADTGTTFDGVFTSTYKTYKIVIENFFGSSAAADLYLQLRYAGPTTQAGNYNWNDAIIISNGTTATAWANPSNFWQLSRNTESSGDPLSGEYTIFKVGNASEEPQLFGTSSSSQSEEATNFTGQQTTARTYTGLIFSASTGTISGTIAIYGLAV
jgi:hypothetical protein